MNVRTETRDAVHTVVLHRPEVRNAVDRPTADALAEAMRRLASYESAATCVLWGEGGHFCAGADLEAVGTEHENRLHEDGDGPMGPTRLRYGKPTIAGAAVAGGLELAL